MIALIWMFDAIALALVASIVSVLIEDEPIVNRAEGLTTADVRRMAEESLRRPL